MKKIVAPREFCGVKFAARYRLEIYDFFICNDDDGIPVLHYPDALPDDPTLETSDPPVSRPEAELGRLGDGTHTDADVRVVMAWMVKTGRV